MDNTLGGDTSRERGVLPSSESQAPLLWWNFSRMMELQFPWSLPCHTKALKWWPFYKFIKSKIILYYHLPFFQVKNSLKLFLKVAFILIMKSCSFWLSEEDYFIFIFFFFTFIYLLLFPQSNFLFPTVQHEDPVTHTCIHNFFSHCHAPL